MNPELLDYDIFPKVFRCGEPVEVCIRPLGAHVAFIAGEEYLITVQQLDEGSLDNYPERDNCAEYELTPCADGCLRFTHTYEGEQEHFVNVMFNGKRIVRLCVYSLFEDLAGRYPFMGDLHMHTCRSDGKQAPAIVAANYRRHGYDFLAITDHNRYYPSLEAMDAFKDVPVEYTLVPGEEVHMPKAPGAINDIHIVNFGGSYSVNALVEGVQTGEVGTDKALRSLDGKCPEVISQDEYRREVRELQATLDIPDGVEGFAYASCVWIFNHIRAGGGLGIFCHPYWISNVFQVPETFVEYMMETQPFDAFEVLGGENYFEQNGFQTVRYYEDRAKGRRYPIVGSTDSHNSTEHNENAFVASTVVFSPENTREALISSIKDCYSAAVDGISREFRVVGEMRFVRYTCFLLKEFFPLHDELCFEEGRLMKEYACGNTEVAEDLRRISGRMRRQREKYFNF